ncbi:MAG: NB-ARC domain-containing protein, partial [Chloroflexota bacterium]|nr:NB-ARC domain-containing protein [Chloroflexota bacterium]
MTESPRFNVFLSYARKDDDPDYDKPERSFMRRLYRDLTAAGLRVWWDRESLPTRGEAFTAEIERAIRACDRFVLVAGYHAVGTGKDKDGNPNVVPDAHGAPIAASEYVTAEWRFAYEQCVPITPILRAGDFPIIPAEVSMFNAIDFRPSRSEADALRDLIARLRQEAKVGRVIPPRQLPEAYIQRDAPFHAAREVLCADAITPTVISAPARAAAIYGMGGIGKSTLAAALADDCQIRRRYSDDVLWVTVGQTPDVPGLQAVIGTHFGDSRDNYDAIGGTAALSRALQGRQALIVLDDVWDATVVERFPVGGTACRLLITTRSGALAARVQGADIRLGVLTADEGARLMTARIGSTDPLYHAISVRLGGHTLAVALAAAQIAEGYADDAADMLRLLDKREAAGEPFKDLTIAGTDKDGNLALSLSISYDAL